MRFLVLILTALSISSCHKHEEIIAPEDYTEYGDINVLFEKNIEDIKVIEPFEVATGLKYAINNKSEINIPANSLYNSNDEIAKGSAEIAFIEIYEKGTMAICNKPTTYKTLLSKLTIKQPLGSVAEFFIRATQNGKELTFKGKSSINIPIGIVNDVSNIKTAPLTYYEGITDKNGDFLWSEILFDRITEKFTGNTYNYIINNNGWNSLFKDLLLSSTASNYIDITFSKPKGLNNTNSKIFIAFEKNSGALAEENCKLPEGEKAHYILTVANPDNTTFKYAIKPAQKIEKNKNIAFTIEELKDATAQELKNIINKLP